MLDRRIKSYREVAIPREPSDQLYPGTNYYGNGGENLHTNRDPFLDSSWKDCSRGQAWEMRSVREWVARTRDADLYRLLYDLMLSRYPARLAQNDTLTSTVQRITGVLGLNSMFAGQFQFYPTPIIFGETNINRQMVRSMLGNINPLGAGGEYGVLGGLPGTPSWPSESRWLPNGYPPYWYAAFEANVTIDLPQVFGISRPNWSDGMYSTQPNEDPELSGYWKSPFQIHQELAVVTESPLRRWRYFPSRSTAIKRMLGLNLMRSITRGLTRDEAGAEEFDLLVEGRAQNAADPRYLWWRAIYTNSLRTVLARGEHFDENDQYIWSTYTSFADAPANRTESPRGWDLLHNMLCNMSLMAVVPRFIYMPTTNNFEYDDLANPAIPIRYNSTWEYGDPGWTNWILPRVLPDYTISYGMSRHEKVDVTNAWLATTVTNTIDFTTVTNTYFTLDSNSCSRAYLLTDFDENRDYWGDMIFKKNTNAPYNPELVTTPQRCWVPTRYSARPCWGMDLWSLSAQNGFSYSGNYRTDTNGTGKNIFSVSLPHANNGNPWYLGTNGIPSSGEPYPYTTQNVYSVSKNRIWFSVYPEAVPTGSTYALKFTVGKWKLGIQHARILQAGVQICSPGPTNALQFQDGLYAVSFEEDLTIHEGDSGWKLYKDEGLTNYVFSIPVTNGWEVTSYGIDLTNKSFVALNLTNNIVDLECGLWSLALRGLGGIGYARTSFLVGYLDLDFQDAYIVDPWDDSFYLPSDCAVPEKGTNAAFRYARDYGEEQW